MKEKIKSFLKGIITGALIALSFILAFIKKDDNKKIEEAEKEIKSLEKEIEKNKEELLKIERDRKSAKEESADKLEKLNKQIEELKKKKEKIERKNKKLKESRPGTSGEGGDNDKKDSFNNPDDAYNYILNTIRK